MIEKIIWYGKHGEDGGPINPIMISQSHFAALLCLMMNSSPCPECQRETAGEFLDDVSKLFGYANAVDAYYGMKKKNQNA